MILFGRNTDTEIVVIAEVGLNHGGSIDWIKDLLPAIKLSGADAVKFQLFTPELFVSPENTTRFNQISQRQLSESQFESIFNFCQNLDLPIFASAISHDWVPFIAELCKVVKIASGDFNFRPTVEAALISSAQVILSTGACTRDEVIKFIEKAKAFRSESFLKESVAILHCISAYPANLSQANLLAIPDLQEITNLTVGFSSHFMEDAPIFGALALGARIFEIHVTSDRSQSDFRDHALSRTPHELARLISELRELDKALKSRRKTVQEAEKDLRLEIRKGFRYAESFRKGRVLQERDIVYARPSSHDFSDISEIVGCTLRRNVTKNNLILKNDIA